MIMPPYNYKSFYSDMYKALANGDINLSRVDDAVERILKIKIELDLFDQLPNDSLKLETVGSQKHKELARRAVRESQVLLKNENSLIPITKNTSTILVAGSAAHNLGMQFGGWTVEWQGVDGNWLPGTTILQGIQDMVNPNAKVEYNLEGNFIGQESTADIGIAIVGESPYAEGWGDKENPKLSEEDVMAINNLRKISKKLIVILVSGRPLNIKEYAKNWDAIIAAWLPGSEGQGVADMLFGDYTFTGTLPVEWKID